MTETRFAPQIERAWPPVSGFELVVADLPEERRVSIFRRDGGVRITTSPAVRASLPVRVQGETGARAALAAAGVALHDPDRVLAVPRSSRDELLSGATASGVRVLDAGDVAAFERFAREAPAQDLDDAYVELDHWLVVGAFDGERLVAAGSAYPWGDEGLADMGVITLPDARGTGRARGVVHELCRRIVQRGAEPQYRTQLDNPASLALARSAGLAVVGDWEVVEPL